MLEAPATRRAASAPRRGRAPKKGDVPAGYRVAEVYFERRGGALDRRQHLQGQGRQRPARPRGGVRRHRPRQERLPARRRDRAAGRRAGQARPRQERPAHHRPAQAGAGDRRPGRQGPAEDQGRAALDGAHHRRALHGLRARPARASASRAGSTTRSATACARRPSSSTSAAAARSSAPRPTAPSARTSSASCSTCSSSTRCSQKRVEETTAPAHGLPGGRPLDPRRARHLLRALRARDRRRPQAAPPAGLVLHAHRAGARRPRRAVGGADGRCSRPTASTR